MAVPDFQSILRPVLEAGARGARSSEDYRAAVAEAFALSEADMHELLPSGRQTKLANRVAWSLIHLQRAGLLTRVSRGIYEITDAGRKALQTHPDGLDLPALRTYPAYQDWQASFSDASNGNRPAVPALEASEPMEETTPVEQIEGLVKRLDAELAQDLLRRILENSWQFFEQLVIDTLVAMGYGGGRAEMAQALKTTGDGGIDGIIKQDPLGLDIVYVQAKRHEPGKSIGRPIVQAFSGALDHVGAHKGVFITTSSFSAGAVQYAEQIAKRLILVDGAMLARHMIDHGVGVRVKETYAVRDIDDDYFPH